MNKLFVLLLSLLPATLFSQTSPEEQKLLGFVKNINAYNHLYPQEKVYLHFDNTAYFLGETIWFKAYLATADSLNPSPFSKVVYVELLSPEGYVIYTKKLKAENGQCHGEFALSDSLSLHAGFYEVRAYTRAMLNFGEDVVFSRVFPVFDHPAKAGVYEKKMTLRNSRRNIPDLRAKAPKFNKLNLQFFPEGGSPVQGLPCVVAFKATDEQGESAEVSGKILNDQNDEIADLATVHEGMGYFSFLPDGKAYKAKVQYQGKEYTFALPNSLPAGYALNVQNLRSDEVGVRVQKTQDLLAQPLGITLICRGKLLFFKTFSFDASNEYALQISKAELPSGINQITLFDAKGEILAERLFFIPPKEEDKVKIDPHLRNRLEPYGLVNVDFDAKDFAGQPVKTTFSLAIHDAATEIPTTYTDNLQSYFLLISDLKGYVEQPDYCFEADDNLHRLAADLLMMTQGWRRYEWKEMAGVKPFEVKQPIEQSIIVDGTILSPLNSKPVPNAEVTMWASSPEKTSKQGKCMTDTAGRFNFDLEDIYGEWNMSLQVKEKEKNKMKASRILLNRTFSPQAKAFLPVEMELSKQNNQKTIEVEEDTISNQLPVDSLTDILKGTHQLPEVMVSAKKPYRLESEGQRYADIIYDVDKTTDDLIDRNEDDKIDILDFLVQTNKYFTYYDEIIDNKPYRDITVTYCRYKGSTVLFVVDNNIYIGSYTIVDPSHFNFQGYTSIQDVAYKKEFYDFIQISGSTNIYSTNPEPKVYEVNVHDFKVDDIKSIMISEDPVIFFKYCPDCSPVKNYTTIFLYTKVRKKLPANMRETKIQGFSIAREFYNPQYDSNVSPKTQDVRRTLYWNPDVQTDSTGVAAVQFYNNASGKDINVDMERF